MQIEEFLMELDASNDFASIDYAGLTVEGRDLWILKISDEGAAASEKSSISIDCGIHARESVLHPILYCLTNLIIHLLCRNMKVFRNII